MPEPRDAATRDPRGGGHRQAEDRPAGRARSPDRSRPPRWPDRAPGTAAPTPPGPASAPRRRARASAPAPAGRRATPAQHAAACTSTRPASRASRSGSHGATPKRSRLAALRRSASWTSAKTPMCSPISTRPASTCSATLKTAPAKPSPSACRRPRRARMARLTGSTSSITLTRSASPVAAKSAGDVAASASAPHIEGAAGVPRVTAVVAASQASHTSTMASVVDAGARPRLAQGLALQHHDRRGDRQDERQRGERQTIDPRQPDGPRRRACVGRDGRFEQRRAVRTGDDEALRVRGPIAERSPEGHRAVGGVDDVGLALAAGVRHRQTRFRRHRPEPARARRRFVDRLDGHEPETERGVGDEQVGAVEHAIARQLRRPPGPRERLPGRAVDRQGRAVRRRIEQGVDGGEQAARRLELVTQAGPNLRLPRQRRGHPLQIGDEVGDVPAGVGLEAGPDGGVVAEPPRDEPAAGRRRCPRRREGRRRSAGRRARHAVRAAVSVGASDVVSRIGSGSGGPSAGTGGLLQDTVSPAA